MDVDQDWPSVYPVAAPFKPSAVPLPVRMGYPVKKGVPLAKEGNLELLKVRSWVRAQTALRWAEVDFSVLPARSQITTQRLINKMFVQELRLVTNSFNPTVFLIYALPRAVPFFSTAHSFSTSSASGW